MSTTTQTVYQVTNMVLDAAPATEFARITKTNTDLMLACASEHHADLSNLRLTVTTEPVVWGNGKTYTKITTVLTV